jgi:hypothetical protein
LFKSKSDEEFKGKKQFIYVGSAIAESWIMTAHHPFACRE